MSIFAPLLASLEKLWRKAHAPASTASLDAASDYSGLSREHLQFILDNALDLICHLDQNFIVRYISPSMEHTLGLPPSAMVGTSFLNWFERVHPDDRDRVKARFLSVVTARDYNTAEYRFRHTDGHYLWLEARVRVIAGSDGQRQDIIILARAIDERKQAEAQVQLLAEAVRSTDDGVFITDAILDDPGPTIQFANEAITRITGYTQDELIGHPPSLLVGEETDRDIRRRLTAALRVGHTLQTRVLNYRKDGSSYIVDLRAAPVSDPDGKVAHYVVTQRDITEGVRTEEALRDSEALFRAITEATMIAIAISRLSDDTIIYANTQCGVILGRPIDDVIGKRSHFYLDPEERARLQTLLEREGIVVDEETQGTRADGQPFWAVMSMRAVLLKDEPHWLCSFSDVTQRHAAERDLGQSQERYQVLINSIDGIVWEGDLDSLRMSFVSQQIERMLGYTVEQILGDPNFWSTHIHADDVDRVDAAVKALANIGRYEVEFRVMAADSRVVWVRDIARVIQSDTGAPRAIGIIVDISAYKSAQAAEQEQRALAEALRDTAATLSSTLDQDEVLDRILEQMARVVPHDIADIMLIDSGVAYIVRAHGRAERGIEDEVMDIRLPVATTPTLRRMIETGEALYIPDVREFSDWVHVPDHPTWLRSYVGAPIRLDGRTIGFLHVDSATANVFNEGHAVRLQAFADQAAIAIRNARLYRLQEQRVEQRTAELALERNRLRVILDESGEGIYYSENGLIQYANKAICEMTGYHTDELIGATATELFQTSIQDKDQQQMLAVIYTGNIWRHDLKLRRKDGSLFDAGLTLSLVGKPDTEMQRTVTIVRDISQEKALAAQKARFVAHASHELRTPLTNLVTRLYLLRRQPERLPDHLEVLDEVVARMRRLVEDLLDVSRFERGAIPLKRQTLILQTLVDSVVQIQQPEAERKGIALVQEATETPLEVNVDPERIVQVVTNLLINAINYTPSGGEIEVNVYEHDRWAVVGVRDNGVGIATEHLPYIFQPFYRVMGEAPGTGLGLSIAREIVELHGGEITVESTPGTGSKFAVRLVQAPPTAATRELSDSPEAEPTHD